MARTNNLSNFLTDVASAIKEKKGDSTNIPASSFDTEILSLPSQGIYQSKQMTINTNGNYEITPDNGYDAIESLRLNVEAGEDLTEVLNTQDQKIAELEAALENKTAGKAKLHIFIQEDEPTEKNGIWLQSNKTFDEVCVDTDIIADEEWLPSGIYNDIPTSVFANGFYGKCGIYKDGYIYLFYGDKAVKYNVLTQTFTQLETPPFGIYGTNCCCIDNEIHFFSGNQGSSDYKKHCKYNIDTNTYGNYANMPYDSYNGASVAINNKIYIFGGGSSGSNTAYAYDLSTNSYTRLKNMPYSSFVYGDAVAINNEIYIFGCYNNSTRKTAIKYDTITDTYTKLTDIPSTFYQGRAVKLNNEKIFLFGSNDSTYKKVWYIYDVINDSYERPAEDMLTPFYSGAAVKVEDEKIFLIGGTSMSESTCRKIQVMNLLVKEYEDNSILISQGTGDYNTQLINAGTSGKLNYYFHDVWHYTREDGLDKTIPTYYGNGTEWVKFKN